MPHVFSDSLNKAVVRDKWNTPLLRHLHDNHGCVYRYFGLPGPDVIDIKLWRDMITEVVAFEIPASTRSGERTYINKLRRNLEVIGIRSTTYYGPFEEVVLLRRDFDGQEYAQRNVITLYNLDFCGEIGSKVMSSEGRRLYRLEAIRQVIRDQIECFIRLGEPSLFIVLLTVRNQMQSRVLRERLTACRPLCEEFITTCEAVNPITDVDIPLIGTHAWALKAVIHSVFTEALRGNNISALFFPLIKYNGVRTRIPGGGTIPSPMLHLMIFCRFQPQHQVVGMRIPENPLLTNSLAVVGQDLQSAPEPGEEIEADLSPVAYFETLKAAILG